MAIAQLQYSDNKKIARRKNKSSLANFIRYRDNSRLDIKTATNQKNSVKHCYSFST